jgi:hypothetical protein
MGKIQINKLRFVSLIFLAVYLAMIIAPANQAKDGKRNKKSECMHKKNIYSYPTIKANKKSPGYNKNLNRPKKRNHSYPV